MLPPSSGLKKVTLENWLIIENCMCVRRDRSRRFYVASHNQHGETEDSLGWEPKALHKTNISGQQRGQEQRGIWGEGKGNPLDGHEQGNASQELYFRKSFLVFLLGMGELLLWSHGSSYGGTQFMSLLCWLRSRPVDVLVRKLFSWRQVRSTAATGKHAVITHVSAKLELKYLPALSRCSMWTAVNLEQMTQLDAQFLYFIIC